MWVERASLLHSENIVHFRLILFWQFKFEKSLLPDGHIIANYPTITTHKAHFDRKLLSRKFSPPLVTAKKLLFHLF